MKNWKELVLNGDLGDCLVEKVRLTKGCKANGRRKKDNLPSIKLHFKLLCFSTARIIIINLSHF